MTKYAVAIFCFLFTGTQLEAQSWSEVGTGTHALNANNSIYTMCTDIHGNIYVAGWIFDDSGYGSVYKWDGINWAELGHGSTALSSNWEIDAIYADTSGNVYASAPLDHGYGIYTPNDTYYVAKWNGVSWNQVGTAIPYAHGGISAITMDRYGSLYAVGGFIDSAGGYYVAKWDGSSWSEVGTDSDRLNANSYIDNIFIDTSGNIFVAGSFTDGATDTSGNLYVAKWDGTTWSEVGSGVVPAHFDGGAIYSVLEDTAGNVYAGGWFVNSSNKFYVSKWDGASWSELGMGSHALNANNMIESMSFDIYGNIYAAGAFTDTTTSIVVPQLSDMGDTVYDRVPQHPCYVAKWDGTNWSKVGTGTNALNANDWISAICTDATGNIYSAGSFTDTSTILTIVLPDTTSTFTQYGYPHYVARYGIPTTGVMPLYASAEITLYPNPATTELTVTATENITAIKIRNLVGQTVFSKAYNMRKVQVDITDLSPGVYFVKVNGLIVRKFIKE